MTPDTPDDTMVRVVGVGHVADNDHVLLVYLSGKPCDGDVVDMRDFLRPWRSDFTVEADRKSTRMALVRLAREKITEEEWEAISAYVMDEMGKK